jgi:hypothetical protein
MRRALLDLLPRGVGADALAPPRKELFLVYLMAPYQGLDVESYLPDDAEAEPPSWATWDDEAGSYSEDDVMRLLTETRDCLRDRGYNAFRAIDVGIDMDRLDPAAQSIAFARASNAVVFVVPEVGANLGVGIEIGSVLEDLFPADSMTGPAPEADPPARSERFMVVTDPDVSSAMLRSVHARWDAAVRSFSDPADLCRVCAQFCRHVEGEEQAGRLPRRAGD